MPRLLLVNADDLGANVPRNAGVLEAHLRGIVTGATMLVNLPGAEDAAARARLAPRLGVGLHLNLSEGRPIGSGYRTLAGPDGAFWGKEETRRRFRDGGIDPGELAREIEAQLDRMEALGLKADHVDGHHHVQVYPGVIGPLSEAMRRRGIAWIRLPATMLDAGASLPPDRRGVLAEYAALTPPARKAALEAGLRTTEAFVGASLTGRFTSGALLEALVRAPEGATELMVHPGYADPASGGFSGPDREEELAVLTDPELRTEIARLGLRLASFRDLS